VHFVTRDQSLELLEINLHSFELVNVSMADVTDHLLHVPEIECWLTEQRCGMDELQTGSPVKGHLLSIHANDSSFAMVLDDIAAKSGGYFWSVIRYSRKPCAINIAP
jgi:hypothetical protein